MRATHKYVKRTSSTYVFNDSEVLEALGKAFNLPGWTEADMMRRFVEYDQDRGELILTLHYDQPDVPQVPQPESQP